ncbi:MAG TPA: IS21 family transposase [Candidatus Dormibacteraeota bacterium]|nr:IS21 family transposase [Candidatus Dormibacteraeota bacterium]
MRKITEVLRLAAQGRSNRDIATSVDIARSTVTEYLRRAAEAGLSWPLPEDMDAEALEAALFPAAVQVEVRPVPDWRSIHKELKNPRHHVTLRLLWIEWKADHPDGWRYSQFCHHYRTWLGAQDIVMRLSYAGGDRMFVDFAGDRMSWVDPDTGEVHAAEIFVAVLGASGKVFARATRGQDLDSWLSAHVAAWDHYGGVAAVTVPDNLRSGVTKACWYDPEINPAYAELAAHYDTVVLPARPRKPRDKAAAEAGVLAVERWVLAPLRNRSFHSLAELNEAIAAKLAELNAKEFRGEPTSRDDLFTELEAGYLRPLPAARFELATWRKATVHIDYHVDAGDGHFYSVPYRYVRQKVECRITAETVEVLKGGVRIASHPRERGRRRYITDPAHMPPSHRAHLEWNPERLVSWAGTVSATTAELVERILESRPHPEHAYRACLGIMSLARRYGNDRVGAASARALAVGAISYSSVKSILAENLDRLPLPEPAVAPPPPEHDNLRGAEYYAEEAEGCS